MLKPVVIIIFLASLMISPVLSQENLYIPTNYQKAFDSKTRSKDGKPGENYWQNHADYEIYVELIPEQRKLVGDETISYENNSPDSLKNLYLKIYQDIYKKGNLRDFALDSSDIHSGTHIHTLSIDGDSLLLSGDESPITRSTTFLRIKLDDPLPPGEDLELNLGWETLLPKTTPLFLSPTGFRGLQSMMMWMAGTGIRTRERRSFIMILVITRLKLPFPMTLLSGGRASGKILMTFWTKNILNG
jgi:hypothetical protein